MTDATSRSIEAEYNRVLDNYLYNLQRATKHIASEINALEEARKSGWRFRVRHGLLDLADEIIKTNTKLEVFSNLTWDGLIHTNRSY